MANFKRLHIEAKQLETSPPEYIRAKPSEKDLLTFHYVIQGPPDTPYHGGYYHGVLIFPPQVRPRGVGTMLLATCWRLTRA